MSAATLPTAQGDIVTLIDRLLTEQQRLTAVDRFSRHHDQQPAPLLERHYRDLLPLSAPRPGEQYAFEVDLDRCSGCKGCVTACHALNGLDDDEAWREVGLLVGGRCTEDHGPAVPLQQTVTTACHHCLDPGCLSGCPVLAYEKDPATGIVRHLDDQCIGCRYCLLTCPYEVPKYSERRGIVRKCDLCHGRLAVGEAPACVQACPNEAIRIARVNVAAVRDHLRPGAPGASRWLPDAPDPALTLPTTRYRSVWPNERLEAADHDRPRVQPTHWPLILMLVLTQAGIGGMLASLALGPSDALRVAAVSLALFVAGLVASAFHLGRPGKAWRVWLGWRTSWLSREAMALGAVGGITTAAVAALVARAWPDIPLSAGWRMELSRTVTVLSFASAAAGLGAIFAQARVYAATGRPWWRLGANLGRFAGTAALLGAALALAVTRQPEWGAGLAAFSAAVLGRESRELVRIRELDRWQRLRRPAVLLRGPLARAVRVRLSLGLLGGVALPLAGLAGPADGPGVVGLGALILVATGEVAARWLFFTAAAPDKMPGLPG